MEVTSALVAERRQAGLVDQLGVQTFAHVTAGGSRREAWQQVCRLL